ncbi:small ubiquitin-related modifier 1 [Brachypodium distachyon]|uniref:Ubiquitin-like domain-containing protein n=1 Tax=Brachypodium distachyon TaxID=15368 RepID=I1HTG1_BRADI|nr:small ubiquitin-related modifier 1 [Brachypodium distachyon]KQK10613.1 hypothetical protein BRADI_2g55140v3 [Brachypodium distachyon]|eukprot:XP_003567275.1 small ubiquitin-related modifier 1 [Brachypodium distachyon]
MPSPPPPSGHDKTDAEPEVFKPVKPEPTADGDFINVTVTSQISVDVLFRIKRNARLQRLMDMYCGKHSLDPRAVRFLNDEGKYLKAAQTADEAGLKDGGLIDVHMAQDGGFAPSITSVHI